MNFSDGENKLKDGFTLIEMMVTMLILALVMAGMTAVSVAGFKSYQKSKAIKIVSEDIGFAINSITKDVRMGTITSTDVPISSSSPNSKLVISRNLTGNMSVCYMISNDRKSLDQCDSVCSNCDKMVDLSGSGMTFSDDSGFYNMATDNNAPVPNRIRGWAEINLNIENPTMEKDSIHVQSMVSSRD
jgi:prepilin-type N-terminal cleavage/methylation domain-containing protein